MKEPQINLQSALNPENKSHMALWEWLNDQTTNRSSFIRETLFMRMWGIVGGNTAATQVSSASFEYDQEEIMRLIQV